MPIHPLALAVVVGCALAWASFDFLRKAILRWMDPMPLVFLLTALQTPLFALWVAGTGAAGPPPGELRGYLLPAAGSVALGVVSNVLFVVAIKISPLSLTIPLLSLTPVFTTLLAIPLLGQVPRPIQVVGIGLVVIGALALHRRTGGVDAAGETPWRAFLRERGAVMMAAVALMWSVGLPLDKLAIDHASPAFHALVLSGGVAAGLGLVLAVRGRLGAVAAARRRPGLLVLALTASAVALALQVVAIQVVLVSVVETVKRGLGNAAAVAVGGGVFGERVGAAQWLAVALMAAGVALILW